MAERQTQNPMIRRGPVPLPLHLTLAWTSWNGSLTALPHVLPYWKKLLESKNPATAPSPELQGKIKQLGQKLDALQKTQNDPNQPNSTFWPDFQAAVGKEAHRRFDLLQRGIDAYRTHPYQRPPTRKPTIWQNGSSELLDYGADGKENGGPKGAPVLFIPSLVNRGYVLDLTPHRSFLRWLAKPNSGREQMRPLALEWGPPGVIERDYTLTDYIVHRLEPALDRAVELAGGPVPIVGYCMGGLLAVALTQRQPSKVSKLALLATPWDFHAGGSDISTMSEAAVLACRPLIDLFGELPVDILQALFATLDPFLVLRKFQAFATLDPNSPKAQDFVALEDWINDGVPLAGPVAMECLQGWYVENTPMTGNWKIDGQVIDPSRIEAPTLLVVPRADRIVPPRSALGLVTQLGNTEILRPDLGHIGMVTSRRAETQIWSKLASWLEGAGAT